MNISLVTISYNQALFLPECLESVCSQLGAGDEYIVVDPGSRDNSRHIISEKAGKYASIQPVFESDLGPGDGLNKGFKRANSEIFAYLNSDDFLLPGCLAYVRAYFEAHPSIDVLIGGIKWTNAQSVLDRRGRIPDPFNLKKFVTYNLHYFQQGTFFRKSTFDAVGGFNNNNRTCWDFELIIDMALRGARIDVSTKPLGAFRVHGESITGKGTNTVAYMGDLERLRTKVRSAGIHPAGSITRSYYKLEHRLNPIRILKQFRPI